MREDRPVTAATVFWVAGNEMRIGVARIASDAVAGPSVLELPQRNFVFVEFSLSLFCASLKIYQAHIRTSDLPKITDFSFCKCV